MAKQKGAVKLSGTIGDISFYQSNNNFLAREKTGPTRHQVLTADYFVRTRENGTEFGHCSSTGKLLRSALGLKGRDHPDTTVTNRLAARLVKVMHSDTESPRGQRRVHRGELSILEGFEFLQGARLAEGFLARYEVIFHREEGSCTLHVPSFMPQACIEVPPHATYVRLVATALALDGDRLSAQKVMCTSDPCA